MIKVKTKPHPSIVSSIRLNIHVTIELECSYCNFSVSFVFIHISRGRHLLGNLMEHLQLLIPTFLEYTGQLKNSIALIRLAKGFKTI
jgi:hypothetical protein